MIIENGLIRAQSNTYWPDFFIEGADQYDQHIRQNFGEFAATNSALNLL